MKKLIYTASFLLLGLSARADDLTAFVSDTDPGLFTGSIDLSVSGGVASFTYSWTGPGGFTASTEDISGLEYGTYTVTVTDVYCGVAVLDVFVDSLAPSNAIAEQETPVISVYPNPTEGVVNMYSTKPVNVEVFNIAGKLLIRKENVYAVDLGDYADGIYLLRISGEFGTSTRRIVKR